MSIKIVKEIIDECINAEVSFSKYDIIEEAKLRKSNLDNYEINNIIKKSRFPIYYNVSTIIINKVAVDIYHINSENPNDYDYKDILKYLKLEKKVKIKPIKKQFIKRTNKNLKFNEKEMYNIIKNNPNNRLYISVTKCKKAGFYYGDKIGAFKGKNYIELIKMGTHNEKDFFVTGTVRLDGDLRFRPIKIMKAFKILDYTPLEIVVKNGNIKVFFDI